LRFIEKRNLTKKGVGVIIKNTYIKQWDYTSSVNAAYLACKRQIEEVNIENIATEEKRRDFMSVMQRVESVNSDFYSKLSEKRAAFEFKTEQVLKFINTYVFCCVIIAGFGLVLLFRGNWGNGIFLIIISLLVFYIFDKFSSKRGSALTAEWRSFFDYYISAFGGPETLDTNISGLYKEIDDFYLESLDANTKQIVLLRREQVKSQEGMKKLMKTEFRARVY
jgi:hypothetical protein